MRPHGGPPSAGGAECARHVDWTNTLFGVPNKELFACQYEPTGSDDPSSPCSEVQHIRVPTLSARASPPKEGASCCSYDRHHLHWDDRRADQVLQHVQIHLHMISRAQHTCEIGIGRRAPKPGYAAVRPLPGPLSGPFVLKLEHGYHHLPVSALLTAKTVVFL